MTTKQFVILELVEYDGHFVGILRAKSPNLVGYYGQNVINLWKITANKYKKHHK